MHTFLTRFAALVTGVLCGFDRLFLRASLRNLTRPFGLQNYLWANRIPFKEIKPWPAGALPVIGKRLRGNGKLLGLD